MARNVVEIEGIGTVYQEKLKALGITTVEQLLEKGKDKAGRKELATKVDVLESILLTWVNKADLFRIKGVAGQFSDLLKAAGVDTVKELKMRVPANLHAKLTEVQAATGRTKVVPPLSSVEDFVKQAKELAPMMTY